MGRDQTPAATRRDISGFNPRARMGRDYDMTRMTDLVSGFNPRARMGRDEHVPGDHDQ